MGSGMVALAFLLPLALTSFDRFVAQKWWHWVHGLVIPALLLAVIHTLLMGARYLGNLEWMTANKLQTGILLMVTLGVFLLRSRWFQSALPINRQDDSLP